MARPLPLAETGTRRAAHDLTIVARILAAIPEAVMAVGADDRILEANAPAKALIPTLRAGVPLASHMRSPDVLDAVAAARAGAAPARASWLERVPVERLFEVAVTPVAGLDCGPIVVLYLREVSEARQFERMRVDFIANASHELRTPLSSLLGFIETLQGPARKDDRARDRFLGIMREAGAADGAARRRPAVAVARRAAPPSATTRPRRSRRAGAPHHRHADAACTGQRGDAGHRGRRAGGRRRRPRRTDAGGGKPHRERDKNTAPRMPPTAASSSPSAESGPRRRSRCAISASASRPSTCPG